MPVTVKFKGFSEEEMKDSTVYVAISVGKGLAANPWGTELEHLQAVVDKLNASKPKNAVLLVTGRLQRHNFDRFLVEPEKKERKNQINKDVPIDNINQSIVFSETEIIESFQNLLSDPIINRILDEKEIDHEIAAKLFAAMFSQAAKKAGDQYISNLKSVWNKLQCSSENKVSIENIIQDWDQALDECNVEKNWDNDGRIYNKYAEKFSMLEKEYFKECKSDQEEDDSLQLAMDIAIRKVLKNKQFVQAGERLKSIVVHSDYCKSVTHQGLLKFFKAIKTLNFEQIGKIVCRNFFLEEIAHMLCMPQKSYYLYPGAPVVKQLARQLVSKGISWKQMMFYNKELAHKIKKSNEPKNKKNTPLLILDKSDVVLSNLQKIESSGIVKESSESKNSSFAMNDTALCHNESKQDIPLSHEEIGLVQQTPTILLVSDQKILNEVTPNKTFVASRSLSREVKSEHPHSRKISDLSLADRQAQSFKSRASFFSPSGINSSPPLKNRRSLNPNEKSLSPLSIPYVVYSHPTTPSTQALIDKLELALLKTMLLIKSEGLASLQTVGENLDQAQEVLARLEDKRDKESGYSRVTVQM